MNWKKLGLAALLVYLVFIATNFLFHGLILGDYYMKPEMQNVLRPDEDMSNYFWVRFLTMAVFSFFFVFIFAKGYEGKGILEGIRFGFYIALFTFFVASFEQFIVYPIPYPVVWYWICVGLVQSLLMGIIASLVYKPKSA